MSIKERSHQTLLANIHANIYVTVEILCITSRNYSNIYDIYGVGSVDVTGLRRDWRRHLTLGKMKGRGGIKALGNTKIIE